MDAIKTAIREGFTVHIEAVELGVMVRLVKDKFFQQVLLNSELVFNTDYDGIGMAVEQLRETFRASATFTGKIPSRLKPDGF